eukprot:gene11475-4639_t
MTEEQVVLFLDIDGVLCLNKIKLPKNLTFDETSAENLKLFINEIKPKIILSSTWRYKNAQIERLDTLFEQHQIPKISGVTPNISRNQRDEEICEWLEKNSNPKLWIAFDDGDLLSGKEKAKMKGHTMRIDSSKGITDFDVKMAIKSIEKQKK